MNVSFEERLAGLSEPKKCNHCEKLLERGMETEVRKESWRSFMKRCFCNRECGKAYRFNKMTEEDEGKNHQIECRRCSKKLVRKVLANGVIEGDVDFSNRKYCDIRCYKGPRL